MEILDQETRHHHAYAVVHPALGEELPHPCIDKRVAGATGSPGLEERIGLLAGVPREVIVESHVHRRACTLGSLVHDVGVELAPRDLLAECLLTR
jgi:hypothetical protein